MDAQKRGLAGRAVARFVLAVPVLGLFLFLPAGTLDFWQAWVFMAVLLVPAAFAVAYFLRKSPALLERRMSMKEELAPQKAIVKWSAILFFIMFLVPGFDRRYGWSDVPVPLVLFSDAMVLLGYAITFIALRENEYASRTVQVEKGQKVIDTGPYSVVRHPMYSGVSLMFAFLPLALGSWWALLGVPPLLILLGLRALEEEKLLLRELPGYGEYCKRVRHRIIPWVW